jgi:hypothetical protein
VCSPGVVVVVPSPRSEEKKAVVHKVKKARATVKSWNNDCPSSE